MGHQEAAENDCIQYLDCGDGVVGTKSIKKKLTDLTHCVVFKCAVYCMGVTSQ